MRKNKTTKSALISSVISLFLCVTMLVGTTFAWFTDSVTSANNVIKSGNLDVEFEYWNGTEWVDVAGKSDILTNTLWEPGVTEVAYLRVANAGSLALKYQLGINIVNEKEGVNVAGDPFLLSDYINFGVVEKVNGETGAYADREAAVADVENAQKISAGYMKAATMKAEEELYLALVVYMPTTVDNVANHNGKDVPQIDLGLNIIATQVENEEDSFGKDYDKDAWADGMKVYTPDDLQDAINNAEPGVEIVLMDDMKVEEPIVIPAAATTYSARPSATVLNLNGKTITTAYNEETQKHNYAIDNYGNVVINGGVIEARGIYNRAGATMEVNKTKIVNLDMNGGSCIWSYGGSVVLNDAELVGYTGCVYSEGYLEINGGTYTCYSAITDYGVQLSPTYNIRSIGELVINDGDFTSRHGLVAVKSNAVINGGTYTMTSIGVISSHVFYVYGTGANVEVNGGEFNCDLRTAQANGSSMICVDAADATVSVKGGTFNHKSFEKYVADGFAAVKHGDFYYVISDDVMNDDPAAADTNLYISTVAELKAFADSVNNGNSYSKKNVVLLADIDLNDETWTPIGISSSKGFSGTFDGQGHTVSNFALKTSSSDGRYGAGFFGNLLGGAAIKNVNFDNVSYTTRSNVVGVAAGYLYGSGTFENIHVTNANVQSFAKVGGILGMAADPGAHTITMTNCSVEGVIGGGYNVGGLIGLVLQGQTVNLTNCETDVVFNITDSGYNYPYVKTDAGWMWAYYNNPVYAGVAEQYCYYDAQENEFCMGEPVEMYFVVTNATQMQAVAQNGGTVLLLNDITGNVTLTQKAGVAVVIDGQGHTFNGTITVDGKSSDAKAGCATTIKNINFVADTVATEACINMGVDGNNNTRYIYNLTVENCTFNVPGKVAVKSYSNGDKNLKVIGCTVAAGMHSLVQVNNVAGELLVEDCKIYSKNGINVNQSENVVIRNCEADVLGYAVRFGASSGGSGVAETYEIDNCKLASKCEESGDAVVILRGTADNATLTITDTTMTGSSELINNATNVTINK